MKLFNVLLVSVCLLIGVGSAALAGSTLGSGGVGGSPPTDWNGAPGFGIEVSEDGDSISIFPDPDAPPWVKQFEISLINGINTNDLIPIWELLTVESGPEPLEITDWHERILPTLDGGDFVWAGGTLEIDAEGATPGSIDVSGKEIWFDFGPIEPEFDMEIHKDLKYIGQNLAPNPTASLFLEVEEVFSVPEPTSIALLCTGGLLMLRRRRYSA